MVFFFFFGHKVLQITLHTQFPQNRHEVILIFHPPTHFLSSHDMLMDHQSNQRLLVIFLDL